LSLNTAPVLIADTISCPKEMGGHKGEKIKFSLKEATKAQRGSRGIALLFL
jgi:hypothetical protein